MGNFTIIIILTLIIMFLKESVKKNKRKNGYRKYKKKKKFNLEKIIDKKFDTKNIQKPFEYNNMKENHNTKLSNNENETNNKINDTVMNGYKSLYREERKKAFEENRKKRYREFMKENAKKGKDFELYVGKEYETLGYTVSYNGIGRKKRDEGIDLIAKNHQEILLIQCKNWKSKKITHKELKEFIANCIIYKEKYLKNEKRNIKNIYITSNDILDKSAKYFINENKNIINNKIFQYNK